MTATALNHCTIYPGDLDASKDFYVEVLGLSVGARPPFQFPGYWLYGGDTPLVHLVGPRAGREKAPEKTVTGRFDHVAFSAQDLRGMRARLKGRGIEWREQIVPDRGQVQVFLHDPDGVQIELVFSAEDAAAAA